MTDTGIGERVTALRKEKELTGHDLAKLSGVDQGGLWRIENGKSNPTLNNLRKLAGALDCDLWTLTGDAPPRSTSVGASSINLFTVPLERLQVAPENPRILDGDDRDVQLDIETLTENIRQHGLLQPLGIRLGRGSEGQGYPPPQAYVVTGQRRLLALRSLANTYTPPLRGDWPVPCYLLPVNGRSALAAGAGAWPDRPARARAILQGLSENLARRALSHHDEAAAMTELLDKYGPDMTPGAIAAALGMTPRHVQMRVKVWRELVEHARHEWKRGGLSTAQAEALLSCRSADIQHAVLMETLGRELTTEAEVRDLIAHWHGAADARRRREKLDASKQPGEFNRGPDNAGKDGAGEGQGAIAYEMRGLTETATHTSEEVEQARAAIEGEDVDPPATGEGVDPPPAAPRPKLRPAHTTYRMEFRGERGAVLSGNATPLAGHVNPASWIGREIAGQVRRRWLEGHDKFSFTVEVTRGQVHDDFVFDTGAAGSWLGTIKPQLKSPLYVSLIDDAVKDFMRAHSMTESMAEPGFEFLIQRRDKANKGDKS